ncbi:flagellar basal body-associated FliL family protein [Tropicimonas sp. TH_r6]|uniref:flagellar basal body-associated FliL family protein n=1 Tax=Tropicimonas sp. TH_r6 TaxID=3082085 RepID=UPI002953421A|nr:flagellar basal body-associated FliL family protein [Tropicimonas sp. TH_r6]MDV7145118.1 flagellar basal body-associated FliL family protein [Tropicimonas sp. TH_r6]
MPLLAGLVLAVLLGGGGFYATYSGMLGGGGGEDAHAATDSPDGANHAGDAIAFVPIEPILVSLPHESMPRHLRFRAEIETIPEHKDAVAEIMPRILDVLNSYLRAVATEDLERPTALIRLRAQMLRRIQLIAGDREIRDLLVTEFVLN